MKRIILCEGKTDAILISYFLERSYGWKHTRRHPVKLPVTNSRNEELNWYEHSDRRGLNQELAIWGVGGRSQIRAKLKDVMGNNQRNPRTQDRFDHVVLFMDHDISVAECLKDAEQWIRDADVTLSSNLHQARWLEAGISLTAVTPTSKHLMKLLVIVLPPDQKGALETFLIDSWKSLSEADKELAAAARQFVADLPQLPKHTYLSHRRLPEKASLGVIFSVFSPDGVFQKIHGKLGQIPWEQIVDMQAAYGELAAL